MRQIFEFQAAGPSLRKSKLKMLVFLSINHKDLKFNLMQNPCNCGNTNIGIDQDTTEFGLSEILANNDFR